MISLVIAVLLVVFFVLDVKHKIKNTAFFSGMVYILAIPLIFLVKIFTDAPLFSMSNEEGIGGAFVFETVMTVLYAVPVLIIVLAGCIRICKRPLDESLYTGIGFSDGGYAKECSERLLKFSLVSSVTSLICLCSSIGGLIYAITSAAGQCGDLAEILMNPSSWIFMFFFTIFTLGLGLIIIGLVFASEATLMVVAAISGIIVSCFSAVMYISLAVTTLIFGASALFRMRKMKVITTGKTFLYVVALFVPILNIVICLNMLQKIRQHHNEIVLN